MNNIFSEIRERVPIKETVQHYGLEIKHSGMACCPFHDDKNPSMKIYEDNFHCFGCGASGDTVGFAARLFNLEQYQAALKFAADFGLNLENRRFEGKPNSVLEERKQFETWEKSAFQTVLKYHKLLTKWRVDFAPKTMNEPLDFRFVESLQEMSSTEYLLDVLTTGSKENKRSLYENNRDSIKRIAERVKEVSRHRRFVKQHIS